MNYVGFNRLSLSSKGDLVFSGGKHLAIRKYYGFTVNLYLLDGMYVEVFYHPVLNKIERIELMENPKTLDLYIDYMNKTGKQSNQGNKNITDNRCNQSKIKDEE